MASRSPREAVRAFRDPIRRALSCVTRAAAGIRASAYPGADQYGLILGDGVPVRLAGPGQLSLSVEIYYRTVGHVEQRGRWEARTAGYMYTLYDSDGREILAYHWHPEGRSRVTTPHLHLGAGAEIGRRDLAGAHLPTGHIALEDVLRLGITEFGVRPLRHDWSEILDRTRRSHEGAAR